MCHTAPTQNCTCTGDRKKKVVTSSVVECARRADTHEAYTPIKSDHRQRGKSRKNDRNSPHQHSSYRNKKRQLDGASPPQTHT
mmetsp:Transcript_15307/g.36418  ORF Transcript_15307/g.36418 Transcript_15307/m.36418 type:complete len:83 (-) Transcript_15307:131-379(-)